MKTMTIGELIDALEQFPADWACRFGPINLEWCGVFSWRGNYAEPACGYTTEAKKDTRVGNVLEDLRSLVNGQRFYGWKGGMFSYTHDQVLHVAQPDESGTSFICNATSPYDGLVTLRIVSEDDV